LLKQFLYDALNHTALGPDGSLRRRAFDSTMRFISTQLRKTVRQLYPLLIGRLTRITRISTRFFPRFTTLVLLILPTGLMKKIEGKFLCHVAGFDLYERDRPEQAWLCLERCLQMGGHSTIDQIILAGMCLCYGLGRFREGIALFAKANEKNFEEATSGGVSGLPFRVLDNVWARHFGHIAHLDYVVKLGILEGRRREDTILYLPPGSAVANRFLLGQVATHLRLVDDPTDLPFPPSAVQALHYDLMAPRLPDHTTAHFWTIAAKTYECWHRQGRAPLFSIPSDIEARGWTALMEVGIPRGAWFVALNVREREPNESDSSMNTIRNADISSYLPAIADITRRGGWVIRIGNQSMTALPPLKNVLDYCHSPIRSDWMDIFLLACCRFMICTNSGPAFVPQLYGVPCVFTNWWPAAERPWRSTDIFIPKMLRRLSDGRYLTLRETLSEPLCWCYSRRVLAERHYVRAENSDPEIIRGAVAEMLERLDGDQSGDIEIAELRSRADRIYQSCAIAGVAALPRDFLRRHVGLID
jgi:putative glycosyltransferase (TIGR04372 family)